MYHYTYDALCFLYVTLLFGVIITMMIIIIIIAVELTRPIFNGALLAAAPTFLNQPHASRFHVVSRCENIATAIALD